jgi:hypothetical protein
MDGEERQGYTCCDHLFGKPKSLQIITELWACLLDLKSIYGNKDAIYNRKNTKLPRQIINLTEVVKFCLFVFLFGWFYFLICFFGGTLGLNSGSHAY